MLKFNEPLLQPIGRVNSIVIHHTDTDGGTAEGLHEAAKTRDGMDGKGLGYHFLIGDGRGEPDGAVLRGRPIWAMGCHCRQNNTGRIGIALIGKLDEKPPTPQQVKSLLALLASLRVVYGALPLYPHRTVPRSNTVCPGAACEAALSREGIVWGRES